MSSNTGPDPDARTTLLCVDKDDLDGKCFKGFGQVHSGDSLAILVVDDEDKENSRMHIMKHMKNSRLDLGNYKSFNTLRLKVQKSMENDGYDRNVFNNRLDLITYCSDTPIGEHLLSSIKRLAIADEKPSEFYDDTYMGEVASSSTRLTYSYADTQDDVVYEISNNNIDVHVGIRTDYNNDGDGTNASFYDSLKGQEEIDLSDIVSRQVIRESDGVSARLQMIDRVKANLQNEDDLSKATDPKGIEEGEVPNTESLRDIGKGGGDLDDENRKRKGDDSSVGSNPEGNKTPRKDPDGGSIPESTDVPKGKGDEPEDAELSHIPKSSKQVIDMMELVELAIKHDGFDPKIIRGKFRDSALNSHQNARKMFMCFATYANIGNNTSNLSKNRVNLDVSCRVKSILEGFGIKQRRDNKETLTLPRIALSFMPEYLIYRRFIHEKPQSQTSSSISTDYQDVAFAGCPTIYQMTGYPEFHKEFSSLIYHKEKGIKTDDEHFIKDYNKWLAISNKGFTDDKRTRDKMPGAITTTAMTKIAAKEFLSKAMEEVE